MKLRGSDVQRYLHRQIGLSKVWQREEAQANATRAGRRPSSRQRSSFCWCGDFSNADARSIFISRKRTKIEFPKTGQVFAPTPGWRSGNSTGEGRSSSSLQSKSGEAATVGLRTQVWPPGDAAEGNGACGKIGLIQAKGVGFKDWPRCEGCRSNVFSGRIGCAENGTHVSKAETKACFHEFPRSRCEACSKAERQYCEYPERCSRKFKETANDWIFTREETGTDTG